MSTSTMTLAAASAPGTAYNVSKPAPMRSPPTCASGNRTLVASRTNRSTTHVRSCGRIFDGNRSHHPAPATTRATARASTTSKMPQPTLETASPTAPRPDQVTRPMSAVIPPNHATTPACLTIGAPIHTTFSTQPAVGPALRAGGTPTVRAQSLLTEVAGYHGVLMSKECVAPNPIVTWSGEPFCVTSGESAGSPLSLSYSTKTCVAHCGVHR